MDRVKSRSRNVISNPKIAIPGKISEQDSGNRCVLETVYSGDGFDRVAGWAVQVRELGGG